MKYAIDVLGAPMYQAAVFKAVPRHIGLGVFAEEFGDAMPFVKKAIQKGYTFFRIQMIWSHKNHLYGDSDIPKLKKLGKAYEDVAKANPSVTIELSPFCEYDSRVKNIDKYCDIVKQVAPSCRIVASPVPGCNLYSTKYKNEIHSKNGVVPKIPSGLWNYSFDGRDQFNTDIKSILSKYSGADYMFLWAPGCNCHADENDKTRNHPATPDYLTAMLYELGEKGLCNLPKNSLLKCMSEKWKPVFITPKKSSKVQFRRPGQIFPFDAPQSYVDGRWRYYISTQGYKLGIGSIWIDGEKFGDVDMGYRINDYR